jgi:hypothetical protein
MTGKEEFTGTTSPEEEAPRGPRLSRRRFLAAAGALLGAGATVAVWRKGPRFKMLYTADRFVSYHRPQGLPAEDPLNPAWALIPGYRVDLLPQNVTPPHLYRTSISHLVVRSLHDGQTIAFHLEWDDGSEDPLEAIDRFRDAVAVQLPLHPEKSPPVTMGAKGNPVHVAQWKASWQRDLERGFQGVEALYPHTYSEVLSSGPRGARQEGAESIYPALRVKNPLAERRRRSPVEEFLAEGFGTLTHHPRQEARGKGVYRSGGWSVTIALPMRGGPDKASLEPGRKHPVAFALWNGSGRADPRGEMGNSGARKHWAGWVELEIRPLR